MKTSFGVFELLRKFLRFRAMNSDNAFPSGDHRRKSAQNLFITPVSRKSKSLKWGIFSGWMGLACGRAARAFCFALLALWLQPGGLFAADKEKTLRIDMGEMDVAWPFRGFQTDVIFEGELEFENNWLEREFPAEFKKGIVLTMEVNGKRLSEATLTPGEDKNLNYSFLVPLSVAATLNGDDFQSLKKGKFLLKLKAEREYVIYGGE